MAGTLYGYSLAEHEFRTDIPRQYVGDASEPVITIAVSAHGGGTVGQSYRDNGWDWSVYREGQEILSGSDLRSGGMGGSHADMARALCSFLAADAESLESLSRTGYTEDPERLAAYDADAREFLSAHAERLSMFSAEAEDQAEAE